MTARLAVPPLLRLTAGWMLLLCGATAVVFAGIGAGIAIWSEPGSSVWASAGWVLQWVAFGGGTALAGATPVLVAHGLTRRHVWVAGTVVVAVLAAGLAALVQLGLWVEWLIHRATGVPYALDGAHLFRGVGEVHLVLAEYWLMFAGFLLTGWLLITGFLRLGRWWGSLAVPLAFLPAAGGLAALSAGWVGPVDEGSPAWVGTTGLPPALGLAAAAALAGALALRALTRAIPIRPR